ncbi:MAG: formate/nitrite transporter family protein [Alphaproteobacteria bacterium]|jgi:formate transporter|nr:formate/nitrite transporter family protein [Alphaproteobacteria bacterium]MBT4964886.1 formate/nitrite transporter family protein [Alphaproteobacteria bacterium]MBT5161622.1 formate/nitrite transporter family protein [Alphaproteobacteria bacterium]MBT5918612.1 formate/nitrite transporter family protein [Alphaproteobacteria bacterium]MBT6387659.1 formate/nitrite transporter family protein [Alphaproteobacteria bacterium]
MSNSPSDHHLGADTFDAYKPAEMAKRVEAAGVAKARMALIPTFTLAILAGGFIAFGAMFYTLSVTGSDLGFGPTRVLGGAVFSLGLILVIVGGAELFTGNNLIVMAWASGDVSMASLMRNWVLVYAGNMVGSLGAVALVALSGTLFIGGGDVAVTALKIAAGKTQLPFFEALIRGVLCNTLVCLAVWLAFAAHTVPGKVMAVIFPVTAFVALGFEHSVANMYLIPVGFVAAQDVATVTTSGLTTEALSTLTPAGFMANLIPVTIGNILGGSVLVAAVYWLCYLRPSK